MSGNVLILVSGMDAQQTGVNVYFDCALATGNMYVAAQGMGLGAHIYMGLIGGLDAGLVQKLEIPEGYKIIAILRVGNIENTVDAVSSASPRKQSSEVVNYK